MYKETVKTNKWINQKFPITYKFWNNDINNFILLLRKRIYPYECVDSWETFNETTLPNKKAFYSELNLKDITDEDYIHAQKLFEELKKKIGWISWSISSEWYMITCRCIWKF